MSIPQAGDPAPNLALADEHGVIHRLADRRGSWTVVYFYPKDDTPGCTTEACQFRDLHGDLTGLDAQIWGVSPDGSGSHVAFRAKFGLPFTLLSDEDHAAAETWGAWPGRAFLWTPTAGSSRRGQT
jgi:thioredoxin-dependent peroxiredoxin